MHYPQHSANRHRCIMGSWISRRWFTMDVAEWCVFGFLFLRLIEQFTTTSLLHVSSNQRLFFIYRIKIKNPWYENRRTRHLTCEHICEENSLQRIFCSTTSVHWWCSCYIRTQSTQGFHLTVWWNLQVGVMYERCVACVFITWLSTACWHVNTLSSIPQQSLDLCSKYLNITEAVKRPERCKFPRHSTDMHYLWTQTSGDSSYVVQSV